MCGTRPRGVHTRGTVPSAPRFPLSFALVRPCLRWREAVTLYGRVNELARIEQYLLKERNKVAAVRRDLSHRSHRLRPSWAARLTPARARAAQGQEASPPRPLPRASASAETLDRRLPEHLVPLDRVPR